MKQSKVVNFLNGKGFYIVLGICMLAVGVTAFAILATSGNSGSNSLNLTDNSSSAKIISSEKPSTAVAGEVSGIKAESQQSNTPEETQSTKPQVAATYFTLPLTGDILKQYSDAELLYSKTYGDLRIHQGLDIKADAGTAVKASGDGVVTNIYKDALLGNVIEIDHGNNVTALYCGLTEKAAVKKGDTVKAGTNIGAVGTIPSECSDESHLHLVFKQNGKYVSPLSLINLGQ